MKTKYILTFPTHLINEPVTCRLIRDFNLNVNIFNAYINSGEEGKLALELEGSYTDIKKGIKYVQHKGIKVEALERKIKFRSSECIHCGSCTAVCYSGALFMNKEWKLEFNPDKCSVCELCTTACPFKLFKIDFVE